VTTETLCPTVTLSHVTRCPSDANFAYIHIAEAPGERFFAPMARVLENALLSGAGQLLDGQDLLTWKKEASAAYGAKDRQRGVSLPEGYVALERVDPHRTDNRKLTVWTHADKKPFTLHPETLARTPGMEGFSRPAKGQIVARDALVAASARSVNAFKSTGQEGEGDGVYGKKDWAREAYSVKRVIDLIDRAFPGADLRFEVLGKGSQTTDVIDNNTLDNRESGIPDLLITHPSTGKQVLLECTGSEMMGKKDKFHLRTDTLEKDTPKPWAKPGEEAPNKFAELWVRPDKIEYARRHPDLKVYVGFHFPMQMFAFDESDKANPKIIGRIERQNDGSKAILPLDDSREVFGFVLPQLEKTYPAYDYKNDNKRDKQGNPLTERFCAFYAKDSEYLSPAAFVKSLAADFGVALDQVKAPQGVKEPAPSARYARSRDEGR
jgi:hypothetical protein